MGIEEAGSLIGTSLLVLMFEIKNRIPVAKPIISHFLAFNYHSGFLPFFLMRNEVLALK